ncbi:hypothetical protein ALO53_200134 [Pseudomonas amygdali pv. photiniae]|uniref:Uncharacterized protein n=1 Tax=Pseudomonas amygdali pv. photiniae TaxID=251724 RepID=A0A0P9TT55_PSEA0|nr:hypothetical protein ALO53_200134 [Pseudomonas amygdali pv. photiniae]
MASDRDQVGEHRVADCSSDLCVRQGVQADIDHGLFADYLHPVKDRSRIVHVLIVRRDQFRHAPGCELFEQRQQRGNDLVEIGLVVADRTSQTIHDRVRYARQREVLIDGNHAERPALHIERYVFIVELALNGNDRLPSFWIRLIKVFRGILLEDPFDVDHVLLDLQVVRSTAQCDKGSCDDVHETPCELTKCC